MTLLSIIIASLNSINLQLIRTKPKHLTLCLHGQITSSSNTDHLYLSHCGNLKFYLDGADYPQSYAGVLWSIRLVRCHANYFGGVTAPTPSHVGSCKRFLFVAMLEVEFFRII